MPLTNSCEILTSLLAARSNDDVQAVLQELGDSGNVEMDQPFGPFRLCWHAFGDNASNISTIGLGTKPGRSLSERLTNAMDAILEERIAPNMAAPTSARTAAKQWFGRPVSGPDDGLFRWSYSDHDYDRRIHVVLNSSGIKFAPTVDVLDDGIGLTPAEFPGTILSLQSGNKIKKRYLIGAFGQGGAATLSFCDYALVVSRHRDNPTIVGFTLIRVLNLDETYKEDTYGYLALKDSAGGLSVPSCQVGGESLGIYHNTDLKSVPRLAKGTLVRHFSYKLHNLDSSLNPSPGNLYHYLHVSMFDPLLPFRLIDLRDSIKDELVTGSRNRLMKLASAKAESLAESKGQADTSEESGSEVRHYRPMEYVVPAGADDASIGIEYWVVLNYRKRKEELALRPQSNELYVQRGHPIIGTLNGQNQGELTASLLRDVGLGMVSRHIVVPLLSG